MSETRKQTIPWFIATEFLGHNYQVSERMGAGLTGVWAGILPSSIWLGWSKLLPHNNKACRKCEALGSAIPSAGSSDVRAAFAFFELISSLKVWGPPEISLLLALLLQVLQAIRRLGWSKIIPKFVTYPEK